MRKFLFFQLSYVLGLSEHSEALGFGSVFNARDKPNGGEQREYRRASVAEKRQRYTYYRGYSDAHTDIFNCLEQKPAGHSEAHEHTHGVAACCTDV